MLEHLPELEYVGSYYSMTLQNSHRKFYEQSYSSISTKVAALHKANDTTSFPSNIVSALKPYKFSQEDERRAKRIYNFIARALGNLPKSTEKLAAVSSSMNPPKTTYHFTHLPPPFSPTLMQNNPEIYMLYRHGSDWMRRDGSEKGKSGAIFQATYAFTMCAAWISYVDTIGRMLAECTPYIEFRNKFFAEFISPNIQVSVSIMPASGQMGLEPLRFCNWDTNVMKIVLDQAHALPDPGMNVIVKPFADETPKQYIERTSRITDLRQSLNRTMESILKNPLVHGPIEGDYSKTVRPKKSNLLTSPMLEHLRGLLVVSSDFILRIVLGMSC